MVSKCRVEPNKSKECLGRFLMRKRMSDFYQFLFTCKMAYHYSQALQIEQPISYTLNLTLKQECTKMYFNNFMLKTGMYQDLFDKLIANSSVPSFAMSVVSLYLFILNNY